MVSAREQIAEVLRPSFLLNIPPVDIFIKNVAAMSFSPLKDSGELKYENVVMTESGLTLV